MNEWIDELTDLCAADEPAVLVTVAGIRGSAPREIGAKMIVTAAETIGTIGGGQLEYQCTRIAAGQLHEKALSLRSFPLGSSMGQCCGGVVEILFEPLGSGMPAWLRDLKALHGQREPAIIATRISRSSPTKFIVTADRVFGVDESDTLSRLVSTARAILEGDRMPRRNVQEFFEPIVAPDLNIAVFGAGHVGTAVVDALTKLDCNIRWVDGRRNIFRRVPRNVRAIETSEPALEVAAMPPRSFFLVMTHSHALDFDICDRILKRNDAIYCGLIGSLSKRRRFEKRFRQQGLQQALIDKLVCPIGVDGISGKKPAEIAVAVAAEILKTRVRVAETVTVSYGDNVFPLKRP
ncbi:MAG: xanthine dehydrogenase accessory protein XdhC [Gammaproteobacteria bacterium]|nr:xanthine dehydrogenase accessory protein XdhC [Gammaproteobacteria bacterium]MBT8111750.1 xanthine dehydrogenase accessory protein XdhC [Gammaproteobacteria bacterium]NND47148.1 xanthine dehydrogenase accessory protein XdhC [Woeseiaceae bacterium]NNL46449.1 xanthine dehydrogenase accessory protein XdhC [Woeseiaceae bacterium]